MDRVAAPTDKRDIATLIVDDTLLYRLVLGKAVDQLPGFHVVGKAENGQIGVEKVRALKPQVVLLDLEMPVMDGFQALEIIRREHPEIKVLIVSSLTKQGGKVTLDALQRGAFDFVTKPETADAEASRAELLKQLQLKLSPLRDQVSVPARRPVRSVEEQLYGPTGGRATAPPVADPGSVSDNAGEAIDAARRARIHVIGIGISTGGPQALGELLPRLRQGVPPICIVQHMPAPFLTAMAEKLDTQCALRVVEGQDGQTLERDTVYIAPGGVQMRVRRSSLSGVIELRKDPAENHCLPAADYLLRSLAREFGRNALGAIFTGMGVDGAKGLLEMREEGALTLAQNEATCTVYGMPKQAVKMDAAAFVLSLDGLGQVLQSAG